MQLPLLVSAALAAAALAQAPPAACCVFGGDGAATMLADGTLVLPGSAMASLATVAIGAGTSAAGDGFVAVLVGTREGPDDSVAGWSIRENATHQTLSLWYGGSGAPTCSRDSVALPERYTSTRLCVGAGGGFPTYVGSYMLGNALASSWFAQGANASSASALMSVTNAGCAPTTVLGPGTPLGGGAYSFAVQGGGPEPAPAAWAEAPAACGF
jgi:hypothetical protein